jgi:hypothetical protein
MLGLKKINPFTIGQKILSPVVGVARKIHSVATSGPVKFAVNQLAPGSLKRELEAGATIADKIISAGEYLTSPNRVQQPTPKMSTVERVQRIPMKDVAQTNIFNRTNLTPFDASRLMMAGARK